MKFAVIQFPGSNCDQDCVRAIDGLDGLSAEYVWHKETTLAGFDAIVLPGGFAYGDYLRCGAIARFSPIMFTAPGRWPSAVNMVGPPGSGGQVGPPDVALPHCYLTGRQVASLHADMRLALKRRDENPTNAAVESSS